ncbi:MAG TPA: hypothetical protein VEQ66_00060 [Propionibacteriaceae bacterium]|nr:hypothetical protein [Propionibacteriaceae bacterium]
MSNSVTVSRVRSETAQGQVTDDPSARSAPTRPKPANRPPAAAGGGRSSGNARHRSKSPRSTTTVLLSLAAVLVAALYVGSLIVLSGAAASANERASWAGPAAISAMLTLYSVVAAFILAFTAAVRDTDKN